MYSLFDKKAHTGRISEDLTQIAEWLERNPSTVQSWLHGNKVYESERYIIFKDSKPLKSRRGGKGMPQNLNFSPR